MVFLRNLTLAKRIGILVVIGLVVSFASFGSFAFEALNMSGEATFQERLTTARVAADHIDQHLQEVLAQLTNVASYRTIDLEDATLEPEKGALFVLRSELGAFADNVYIADKNGSVLWAEPYDPGMVGLSLSKYPHIQDVLRGGEPSVSGIILDPLSRKPVVFFNAPIRGRDGTVVGLLGANSNVTGPSLAGLIYGLKPGKNSRTHLVDGNGVVMASTDSLYILERSYHYELVVNLLRERRSAVTTHSRVEGKEETGRDVVAFVPLVVAPWGILVEQNEAEALAPTWELRRRMVIFGSLALTAAMVLVWLTTRSVVRPVKALTEASDRIAGGDLTTPIPIAGHDEIGMLANSFDAMRQRLQESYAEIEQWNRELENRVEQRTGELQRTTRELYALFEVAKVITSTLDVDSLLRTIVTKVIEVVEPVDAGALFLYESRHQRLVPRSSYGLDVSSLARVQLRPGEGAAGKAYHMGEPVILSSPLEIAQSAMDMNAENRLHLERSMASLGPAQTAVGVPLFSKNEVIGSLVLYSLGTPPSVALATADVRLIQALADQIAIAIENRRLYEEADKSRAHHEADKLKSEFISTVSHELRTPITHIKGYSTSLLRDDVEWDEATKQEFLQAIDEETDRLRDLVDNILWMSKMGAGVLQISPQPIQVEQLARKVVEDTASRAKKHGFTVSFLPGFPKVEADPYRVQQVLHNLLENAVKYSPEGGRITVRGELDGSAAIVSVVDEGVGIPLEEQHNVFQRFYRVDTPLTRRVGGSGLGLAVARGIVEAHGGRIWVDSTMGRGSTFYFTLPLSPELDKLVIADDFDAEDELDV